MCIIIKLPVQAPQYPPGLLQLALPYRHDLPPQASQLPSMPLVVGHIPPELVFPELPIGLGSRGVPAALVTMPEATADEDDRMVLREDYVGLPGKRGYMDTKPVARPMEKRADSNLGGVLAPYLGHQPTAFSDSQSVGHGQTN